MNERPTTIAFLSHLRQLGIELWVENGNLLIDAPKGVIGTDLRDQLKLRKSELVSFLTNTSAQVELPDILPREDTAGQSPLPLSYSQLRQWFLEQLEPGTPAYNIPFVRRLKGPLDISILERCFDEIFKRHESLRTRFDDVIGEPFQEVLPHEPFKIRIIKLDEVGETARETQAVQRAGSEVESGFDLKQGRLIRASLIKVDHEDHILVVVLHHIVSDGWSMRVLLNEISSLYSAFYNSTPSPLPDLPIQYPDYACWQRDFMTGDVLDGLLSYWKDQLQDSPPMLDLNTDFPRPAEQTYNGAYKEFSISGQAAEALRRISKGEGSLFMVLLTALKVLLFRYSRQEDINVGTFIANRNRKELENLIGFFVNTLVLRTDLSGNPTFSDLFDQVRKTAIDAYAHQDLSFELLLDALKVERTMSHTPLFQVMFVFQNISAHNLEIPGVSVSPVDFGTGRAEFDLTLWMWEQNDRLLGRLNYNSDLFEAETMDRMAEHFCLLLGSVAENPEQQILDIPIISNEEKALLEGDWRRHAALSDTGAYPAQCVHQMFERQAGRIPEEIALASNNDLMTYGQLNGYANRVAHRLIRMGVAPEQCVGICLDRSFEMIGAILGILKAGGGVSAHGPHFPGRTDRFHSEGCRMQNRTDGHQIFEFICR